MNKTRQQIKALEQKIKPLQEKIFALQEEEVMSVQRPRLDNMVGLCLRSSYGGKDKSYARVLDLIEIKDGGVNFIFETCSINQAGVPTLSLENHSPYLNKEWWDAPIPVHGWDVCPDEEYQSFKADVLTALDNQKALRKWVKENGY